jgi:alpha-L-fucosidase
MNATPSARQLRHHRRLFYGFLHFTVNTFTDKEWGYGDESPTLFNPTDFDADQIAETARDAGMKGLILTAKHHDGFCLWPSAHTEHSVRHSPWRKGKGDMVREIEQACRRARLEFGVYLSPWDRNHAAYGTPAYLDYYRAQLRELLTHYGSIFEVWFDGANGGDGHYGGARETRSIDNRTYYDWKNTWEIVRTLQPDAMMFSDAGPDIRWVGNERGIAGDPCWATMRPDDLYPGNGALPDRLNAGERDGALWLPAECDVSIRPGWFYHAHEDDKVRSPENLVELYFASVGRGASFLLNLPPDRRGRIHDADVASLRGFRRRLDAILGTTLATHKGGVGEAHELRLREKRPVQIVRLREDIAHGQRIDTVAIDAWHDGAWAEVLSAKGVGAQRLLRLPDTVTDRLRVRIPQSVAPPLLSEITVFSSKG